jgi:plastocyanin
VSKRLAVVSVLAAMFALSMVGLVYAQSAVTMSAVEFAFQPSSVRVASGSVTFNLRNDGQFPHNIQFDGQDAPVFADNLTAGQSASATVNLAPGTYTYYCPVDGHRDRGMVGTLTVAGGAQAGRAGDFDPVLLPGALGVIGVLLLAGGYMRRRAASSSSF